MADDDAPEKPERPLTPQERFIRAHEKEQAEKTKRVDKILDEHSEDLDLKFQQRGIEDEDIRALAVGFAAENIASGTREYDQYNPSDMSDVLKKSEAQAYEADRLQDEQQKTASAEHKLATPDEPALEQERPATVEPDIPKNDEYQPEQEFAAANEEVCDNKPEKELSDAKAERIAKIKERGELFEAWEQTRQETLSHEPGGNEM